MMRLSLLSVRMKSVFLSSATLTSLTMKPEMVVTRMMGSQTRARAVTRGWLVAPQRRLLVVTLLSSEIRERTISSDLAI